MKGCALVLLGAVLVAACGGTATPSAGTSSATATAGQATPTSGSSAAPSATTGGSGPASGTVAALGDAGVAGPIKLDWIHCNQPTLGLASSGAVIDLLAEPPGPGLSIMVVLGTGSITVRLDSGSGSTYKERDFAGTGVTSFDAASGATFDARLTESTAGGAAAGAATGLGAMTSIKGTVDCGGQRAGSSTLVFTAQTSVGSFSGPLSSVRVECDSGPNGPSVQVMALSVGGSQSGFLIISLTADSFTVFLLPKVNPPTHFFTAKGPGVAAITASGAHAEGDATEAGANGATPLTAHLSGDATCGAFGSF
jgi:hypothetical protein